MAYFHKDLNTNIKHYFKSILLRSSILNRLAKNSKFKFAILRYHSVQNERSDITNLIGPSIIHSSSEFDKQMEYISNHYTIVTLDDISIKLANQIGFSEKSVAVTFDDGFEDNYSVALPILEKFGIPATFYVTVGSIESEFPPWFCCLNHAFSNISQNSIYRFDSGLEINFSDPENILAAYTDAARKLACLTGNSQLKAMSEIEHNFGIDNGFTYSNLMMNWDQINELSKMNHIVGSHSISHPNMAYIPKHLAYKEMAESKNILENKLHKNIYHFAYPGPILSPIYSDSTTSYAKKIGYKTATTTDQGAIKQGANLFALNRLRAPNNFSDFLWSLETAFLGLKL